MNEINEILNKAKLKEEDVQCTSQVLYFTDKNFYNSNYKLLELNPVLLNEINIGNTLYIKGDDEDNVVICTESKTFNVCETETSNSLLIVDNLKCSKDVQNDNVRNIHKVQVSGIFHEYLEVSVGKPCTSKLKELLKHSIYKGPTYEFEVDQEKLYSFEELNNMIQASSNELKSIITAMDTVIINNKVRLLDYQYQFRALSYMLKLIDENSWPLDEIDYEETMNTLSDLLPAEVLNCLFEKYCEESKIIDGLQLYKYKESDVCQFFAKFILRESGKFRFDEFYQGWLESVPEGMTPTKEMLYGIAIIDKKPNETYIWGFEENDLPEKVTDRFDALFNVKEKWAVDEISPYIKYFF